jgi:hypothetical protein
MDQPCLLLPDRRGNGPWQYLLPMLLLLLLAGPAAAQGITAKAKLDTASILIGQQARLLITLDRRVDQVPGGAITWPAIADTLAAHVSVLHDSHVDTLIPDKTADPYLLRQQRTLTITSWDSGYWAIPPFRFLVNGDTVATDPLLLTVNTVPVDTTKAIRPIKDVYQVPFSLVDWLRDHWAWPAGGLALLLAVLALMRWLKRRKPRTRSEAPPPPPVPPHVQALRELEELQAKNLCAHGQVKEHCADLADILRAYVERRWQVPALERTTDELIAALHHAPLPNAERDALNALLQAADLAKFAKWRPALPETDQMTAQAFAFVRRTAPAPDDAPTA